MPPLRVSFSTQDFYKGDAPSSVSFEENGNEMRNLLGRSADDGAEQGADDAADLGSSGSPDSTGVLGKLQQVSAGTKIRAGVLGFHSQFSFEGGEVPQGESGSDQSRS